MKSPIFKFLLAVTMLAANLTANAEEGIRRDSLPEGVTHYDIRIDKYQEFHSRLIPRYTKIQFAGSIGMLSGGVGWDYGKGRRWETDLLVGFVPRFESNRAKLTFTLRENIRPWRIAMGTSPIDFHPLRASIGMNAIIGHEFWTSNPERYPEGYYFFSTKFHVVASFGQQWTYNISYDKRRRWRAIGFFYDMSTTDTYLLSGFGNKYIGFKDMFHLSLGLKLQII
ncbi:MAG: hypothetical protein ACI35Q_04900 [Marinilabiliaceae bacterium]